MIIKLIILLSIFITIWSIKTDVKYGILDLYTIAAGFITGFLSFILMLIFLLILSMLIPQELILKETIYIHAIEYNTGTQGQFFLGSGTVSDNNQYYYITDYKDGKKIYNVSQDTSYIIENNKELPRLEKFEGQFINEWWRKQLPIFLLEEEYKFIIPEGSIKYDYNIDLN